MGTLAVALAALIVALWNLWTLRQWRGVIVDTAARLAALEKDLRG